MTLTAKAQHEPIDRQAVVSRHNVVVAEPDSLGSLTVGNGRFAVTVDVTGLQSFPDYYRNGIPLTTMAEWGWHRFPNPTSLMPEETLGTFDLGHGHEEVYAVEYKQDGRQKDATKYFRANPHRLNFGTVGLVFKTHGGHDVTITDLQNIRQELSLWDGTIHSNYTVDGNPVKVTTWCRQDRDALMVTVDTKLLRKRRATIVLRLPYPTGLHADDAADYTATERHLSKIVQRSKQSAIIRHDLDSTTYYIKVAWRGRAAINETAVHQYALTSSDDSLCFSVEYCQTKPDETHSFDLSTAIRTNKQSWADYWERGGIIDFGHCADPRACELERRVVLSQYLTHINCGSFQLPQETGLTYNSWFGRPHVEMSWWHNVHFSLWNHPEKAERMLRWYNDAFPKARQIAHRQGFHGARWMKMTDPWAGEAPSNTGSFLIWQQPHYIYLAEELYRSNPTASVLQRHAEQVEATAEFMADFARSCQRGDSIRLFGATAMQESMSKDFSYAHPFEQAYWVYGISKAQEWRERRGLSRNTDWDDIIRRMAPLAEQDGHYAAGLPLQSFKDGVAVMSFDPFKTPEQLGSKTVTAEEFALKSRSDHPAVLGACGLLPKAGPDNSARTTPIYDDAVMRTTLRWVMDNWNWPTTWGWDYGMVAMAAARLGQPETALAALLNDKGKNTYLPNGHNFQEPRRLRLYLPGNGALLAAVAMMCAGWDGGPNTSNPGFPKDGGWDVRWENLNTMQ